MEKQEHRVLRQLISYYERNPRLGMFGRNNQQSLEFLREQLEMKEREVER
jgi:hypothetical protein